MASLVDDDEVAAQFDGQSYPVVDDFEDELDELVEEVAGDELAPDVEEFLVRLKAGVAARDVQEIQTLYAEHFNLLTQAHFVKATWPSPSLVERRLEGDTMFNILYKELYYRHIYEKLSPTFEQRCASFENYCEFFNQILNAPSPIDLELPLSWLWDIIDEFIYQFQSFCEYRSRLAALSDAEVQRLKECRNFWNVLSVVNVLHSLIDKSRIQEYLIASRTDADTTSAVGEYGTRPLYQMLGFFSIIGLLRLHCQLGDYHLALRMVENVDLVKKTLLMRVQACYATAFYYISFAYIMTRRYRDAVETLSHIWIVMSRTQQVSSRAYQSTTFAKRNEQTLVLLAVCLSLCPQKVDEVLLNAVRGKHGEQMDKVLQGGDPSEIFGEWFSWAAPRFISPVAPDYDAQPRADVHAEPSKLQTAVFLREVKQQLLIPRIRSYLRLYTSISVQKLATLVDMPPAKLLAALLAYKHKMRTLNRASGSILAGEYASVSDLAFYLVDNMIHIAETRTGSRHGENFLRQITRLDESFLLLQALPLGVATSQAAAAAAAAQGGRSAPMHR